MEITDAKEWYNLRGFSRVSGFDVIVSVFDEIKTNGKRFITVVSFKDRILVINKSWLLYKKKIFSIYPPIPEQYPHNVYLCKLLVFKDDVKKVFTPRECNNVIVFEGGQTLILPVINFIKDDLKFYDLTLRFKLELDHIKKPVKKLKVYHKTYD